MKIEYIGKINDHERGRVKEERRKVEEKMEEERRKVEREWRRKEGR